MEVLKGQWFCTISVSDANWRNYPSALKSRVEIKPQKTQCGGLNRTLWTAICYPRYGNRLVNNKRHKYITKSWPFRPISPCEFPGHLFGGDTHRHSKSNGVSRIDSST